MDKSKILITNYPKTNQSGSFVTIGNKNDSIDIVCGYDLKIDKREVTLQIARDLITALLTFDQIYIEGNDLSNIIQVFGINNVKEILRQHILHIIPDQELNPVMLRLKGEKWKHGFFPYPNTTFFNGKEIQLSCFPQWNYIANWLHRKNIKKEELQTILYLIEENHVDIGNINDIITKTNNETDKDISNLTFINDKEFYRIREDGKLEYNMLSRIRLHKLNMDVVLAAILNINNIKMDAAIKKLMLQKTASVFNKDIYIGTDALIRIEQQKGFPDLGELFIKRIINLDDILKLRENFNNKIFRYWVKKSKYDEKLMQQEIMNSINSIIGSKLLTPIRFIGTNLIGLTGFIPGLAASAFDSFILDKISKGWHPNFFLDEVLKKKIDECIEREHNRTLKEKKEKIFKNVGRNDPCPCGSGKKFKKCHGKDL